MQQHGSSALFPTLPLSETHRLGVLLVAFKPRIREGVSLFFSFLMISVDPFVCTTPAERMLESDRVVLFQVSEKAHPALYLLPRALMEGYLIY